MNNSISKPLSILIGIASILIVIRMVVWGGIPDVGPMFWVGVALLLSTMVIFVGLCWYLYFSPLPAGRVNKATQLPASSYLMLLAALVGGLLAAIAVFWDETWHRIYGFSAVLNDFLWAPHKLLYMALGLIALISGMSLYQAIRADRRDVRAGFRAYPYIGMLGLTMAYLIASLPSDQVWHLVFGLDITAWSLPHIALIISFGFAMTSLAAVFLAHAGNQGAKRSFGLNDVLGGIALGAGGVIFLILVTEYDSAAPPTASLGTQAIQVIAERPQWTYPVALIAIGVLIASIGVRLSQRFGVVTIAAIVIAVFRSIAVGFFNASGQMGVVSHLLIGVPMVIIDLWQLIRKDAFESIWYQLAGAAVASMACLVVSVPVINTWLATYQVGMDAIPGAIVAGLLLGAWASLLGNMLGGWLSSLDSGRLPEVAIPRVLGQTAALVVVALVVFLLVFFTATPPTI